MCVFGPLLPLEPPNMTENDAQPQNTTVPNVSFVVTGDPPHCGPPAKYRGEMNSNPVLKPLALKYITDGLARLFDWTHCRRQSVNQK